MSKFEYKVISGVDESLKNVLHVNYGVTELDVEDILTNTQLSKLEVRPEYLYVALQFPEYDRVVRGFKLKEVHCIISKGFLLIIDKHDFKHLNQFNNLKDGLVSPDASSFEVFCEMLDFCITKIFRVIAKFRGEVFAIERDIFNDATADDLVNEIQIVKRNLINFHSIVSPLGGLINELEIRNSNLIGEKGRELLDDSLDKIKKMLNNLSNFREQMSIVTETNDAIVARNTNETIKVLTAVNLLAVIPTALASFFGMNVYFGWLNSENYLPLMLIILLIISTTSLTLVYFKKKAWI